MNMLEQRIQHCEHAWALNSPGFMQMPMRTLKAHVGQSVDLWSKFPYGLQIKISLRYAMHDLEEACAAAIKEDAVWKDHLGRFIKHLCWKSELFQVAEPFQGDNPRLDDTLSLMSRDLDEFASGLDAQFATAVDELMDDSEKQAKQKADEIRGAVSNASQDSSCFLPCGCHCAAAVTVTVTVAVAVAAVVVVLSSYTIAVRVSK